MNTNNQTQGEQKGGKKAKVHYRNSMAAAQDQPFLDTENPAKNNFQQKFGHSGSKNNNNLTQNKKVIKILISIYKRSCVWLCIDTGCPGERA